MHGCMQFSKCFQQGCLLWCLVQPQVSEAEAKKASSGGLWGYISGGGQ